MSIKLSVLILGIYILIEALRPVVLLLGSQLVLLLIMLICHVLLHIRLIISITFITTLSSGFPQATLLIQQTQNICITFVQCWTNVEDVCTKHCTKSYKCFFGLLGRGVSASCMLYQIVTFTTLYQR